MPDLYEAEMRHARHYLKVLSRADDLYQQGGDSARGGLDLFERELENIRIGQAKAAHYAQADETGLCCN